MADGSRRSSGLGARVLWRRLASAPGAAITILVAVLVTAVFVTALPRLFEQESQRDLDAALATAEPEQSNLRALTQGRFASGSADPLQDLRVIGTELMSDVFPESIQSIVSEIRTVVETPPFRVSSYPENVAGPFPTSFRFRLQDTVDGATTLVEGSHPAPQEPIPVLLGIECPPDRLAVDGYVAEEDVDCVAGEAPVLQAAITAETSRDIGLGVGDRALLHPDPQDRLWFEFGFPERPPIFVLEVSGIVELSDLGDEIWFADPAVHRPRIVENPDFRLVFAQGLIGEEQYRSVIGALTHAGLRYTWRYHVDPERVRAERAAELQSDLGRITAPPRHDVVTSLPGLLADYLAQRQTTARLLSIGAISLLAVATGLVLVLAALLAERQAAGTMLARDRGASRTQVTLSALYTGLLLVGPPAVLGYAITGWVWPGTGADLAWRATALVVIGGTLAVILAGIPHTRTRQANPRTGQSTAGRARRIVMELFVLIAAAGAVILLRRRGLADTGPGGEDGGLLLAVTPALLGLAAGLIVLRLVPLVASVSSSVVSRSRGATGLVGLRRAVTLPPAARAPLVVISMGLSVAVFAAVVESSLSSGRAEHVWQVVGADVRIEHTSPGAALPDSVDPVGLAEGRPWVEAVSVPETRVLSDTRSPRVTVFAVDVPAYRQMATGLLQDDPFEGLDDGAGPPRVVTSSRWGASGAPPIGTELTLDMGAIDVTVVVSGVAERFPSLPTDEPFVVMDLGDLRAVRGDSRMAPTTIFLRATADEASLIAGSLERTGPATRVVSRYDVAERLSGDPFSRLVDRGLAVSMATAMVFAAVAAIALVSMGAGPRRRETGLLRLLGMTTRQTGGVSSIELAPPVVIAALFGGAVGGLCALLLSPAVDIDGFTGGIVPAQVSVDWSLVPVLTLAIAAGLASALAIFLVATRSGDEAPILEVGDE